MDNLDKDINQFQKSIDKQRMQARKAQEASLKCPPLEDPIETSSPNKSIDKGSVSHAAKPNSRNLDVILVTVFFMFAGVAGVHFVGRMADGRRLALMTAIGGAGCGLGVGYVIGVSDRGKK